MRSRTHLERKHKLIVNTNLSFFNHFKFAKRDKNCLDLYPHSDFGYILDFISNISTMS